MLAAHLTLSAYGFWLPNDPRGAGSSSVGSWPLFAHGGANLVADRSRSLADVPFVRAQRDAAIDSLKFPPVVWTGLQAVTIARVSDGVWKSRDINSGHWRSFRIMPMWWSQRTRRR
jgi:hypothetical protein